jgi:hypothetical protein
MTIALGHFSEFGLGFATRCAASLGLADKRRH